MLEMVKCICPDCNCRDASECSEYPCNCCHLNEGLREREKSGFEF